MSHPFVEQFLRHRLLAIVRTSSVGTALAVSRALVTGGFRLVEVTLTTPGAEAVIRELRDFGGGLLVGCGTVMSPDAVRRALDWGAQFIVSPHTDPRIIATAKAKGALVMAGALTPTEVVGAWQSGADLVKLFPIAQAGGVSYLQALRGPFPDILLVPTGGIGEADYLKYLEAGAAAVGLGHALAPDCEVTGGRWGTIAGRASNLVMDYEALDVPRMDAEPPTNPVKMS